jgi:hypothetical protein
VKKVTETVVVSTNSFEVGQKIYTIAGLPLSTAIVYVSLFSVAFWFSSAVWTAAPFIVTDSPGYIRAAQDLSDFHVDQLNARPPGYPMLLVLTGSGRLLFHTSLALHFASIWLLSAVFYAMGLTRGWLVLPALLLLLPPYVEYAAYVLSDNLSEFLLVLAFSSIVLWFLRGRGSGLLILSSIAIACTGLTRPTYQILALVVAGFLLMTRCVGGEKAISCRGCIRANVILLTTSVVLIGGFSLLNYIKFNFFGIYPMTGFNLSTRTVRVLERLPDEYAAAREALIKARDAELVKRGEDHTAHSSYWKALPDLVKITGLQEIPDLSQYLLHLHLILIKKAPLNYVQEVFSSFSSYWLPSATSLANMNSRGVQILWVVVHFGILALFTLQLVVIAGSSIFHFSQHLFVSGIKLETRLSLPPGPTFAYFLAGTIVFYNALATSFFEQGDPRYRLPTEPLIFFMCFLGLYLWRQLLLQTESQQVPYRSP